MQPDALQIAEQLINAIQHGDVDAVRSIYAPDCVIWHNNDGLEQSVEDNLTILSWVVRNIRDLRYEEIRRQRTDTGFVEQHVLRGTAPNGQPLNIPACLVCTLRDGRITRVDEYLDSAHLTAVLPR